MLDEMVRILLLHCASKLRGTYDDLPPASITNAKPGASAPTWTTFVGTIQQYTFAINNEVFGTTELTHQYKEGTDLSVHLHFANNGLQALDTNVKFELEYSVSNGEESFATSTTVTKEFKILANTPTRTHHIENIGTIPGTGLKIGAYVTWRLKRVAAVASPAPASNPFILALGIHVQQDTFGSKGLGTK